MTPRFFFGEHLTPEDGWVSMTPKEGIAARIEWLNTY